MNNKTAVLLTYSDTEEMRNESMKQINEKEKDIIQDNADLLELAMRYEYLIQAGTHGDPDLLCG